MACILMLTSPGQMAQMAEGLPSSAKALPSSAEKDHIDGDDD
jgi:hypothetical protein